MGLLEQVAGEILTKKQALALIRKHGFSATSEDAQLILKAGETLGEYPGDAPLYDATEILLELGY